MSLKLKLAQSAGVLAALSIGTAAFAQETTGAIRGQVFGEGGAPVAGATVTIVHAPSGTRASTTTNADGLFDARGLRVGGPYTVSVSAAEYEAEKVDGVFTTLGETTPLDLNLRIAGLVDEITIVAARDPSANNTAAEFTLSEEDIERVVSVNRDIRDLARRSPLVSANSRGDGGISIAGSNPRTNRITIDGAQAQDDFGLNTGGFPTRRGPVSLDAIEQFTVDAVPVDVENGDFQGGAMDMVLKSGGNDFHGSLFYNYLNDALVGETIRGAPARGAVSQLNYGGFLSGPLWQDKLFFAFSYELYKTTAPVTTGPTGEGFATSIPNLTQATIDNVLSIFETNYATDFEAGSIPKSKPILDKKYSAKFDWNIADGHRASFTYRNAKSDVYQVTNLSTTSAGLDSQWYLTGERDKSYAFELNSDWTNKLSTQLRVLYRDYTRLQEPPSGQEFADVLVCTSPTSINSGGDTLVGCGSTPIVRFGPDEFRHANFLATSNFQIQGKAEYQAGDHLLKLGYQGQQTDVFNIFVSGSDGVYYFDSVADFAAGRANQLRFNDAVGSLATEDAAASFKYWVHSLIAQDTWEVLPTLQATFGARFDFYQSGDVPAPNAAFTARNGFLNDQTYDGRSVFMPRASIEWRPVDRLKVTVGGGLFSGGVPDVVLSNAFSNTGVLTAAVDLRRTATGTFTEQNSVPGFNQSIGAAALNLDLTNPQTFYDIPGAVKSFQSGAAGTGEVAAFSPDYEMPSDWKVFLSAQYRMPWHDIKIGVDVVGSKVNNALVIRDTRAQPLIINGSQATLPDGRLRYDSVTATAAQRAAAGVTSVSPGTTNRDLVAMNTSRGKSYSASVWASKSFDFGVDLYGAYTHQYARDMASSLRFASTPSSIYQSPAGEDPNDPAYGRSYDEISNAYKAEISFHRRLFGDNETRITLFGERRSGRGTTFTMADVNTGRGSTFGVNRGANHLLYVPDFSGANFTSGICTAGLVTFDSCGTPTSTMERFYSAVQLFDLPQGQIVPKNYFRNKSINQLDLQLSQQLPGGFGPFKGKFRVVMDLQNVLNFLNDDWGIIEEYRDVNQVISAACATTAGTAVAAGNFACPRYRYSSFQNASTIKSIDTNGNSLWKAQIGIRYEF